MSPDATQAPAPEKPRRSQWEELQTDLKWATPVLFFAVLGLSGLLYGNWHLPTSGTEDLDQVTDAIFSSGNYSPDPQVVAARATAEKGLIVPFEILSALLLAALVAGVVIALREKDGDA